MILLWHFYWPVIVAGLVIGTIAGTRAFRLSAAGGHKRRIRLTVGAGALLAIALALVWHGPLGAGGRLSGRIESDAQLTLKHYEMDAVTARLQTSPLSRRLVLSGPGDDVQQRELARMMDEIPGVSDVRWANPPTAPVMMK